MAKDADDDNNKAAKAVKGNGDVGGDDGEASSPISPFITTSDIVNELNQQLAKLAPTSSDTKSRLDYQQQPRFELQKRLPDGGAVPATAEEISAADFKTKLEQSAKFVSQLATSRDRQFWAEQQRRLGNSFFARGDYKAAMDVYLTCLVVRESTLDFVRVTLVPVLNNLAQCTLQLGMHKRTIAFCSIAIEEIGKAQNISTAFNGADNMRGDDRNVTRNGAHGDDDDDDDDDNEDIDDDFDEDDDGTNAKRKNFRSVDCLALCKIYFKKSKAERLSGLYEEARLDLNYALDFLEQNGRELSKNDEAYRENVNDDEDDNNDSVKAVSLEPYHQAIQKEYRHLDVAEKEARRNQQRQKRAMQKALSSFPSSTQKVNFVAKNSHQSHSQTLYSDTEGTFGSVESRQFSTLRARKAKTTKLTGTTVNRSNKRTNHRSQQDASQSFVQYYWDLVSRVTKFLLTLLRETDERDGETGHEANAASHKQGFEEQPGNVR